LLSGVCVYIYILFKACTGVGELFGCARFGKKKDISRRGWGNLESVKFNRSAERKQGFWLFYVLKAHW
jgi:hypothetical protein